MSSNDEITLRKLEIFLVFMRERSLAGAARALGLSSVSVHKAIHSLESAMGAPLFTQHGRTLEPLKSADVLAAHAADIIDGIQRSVEATRAAAGISPRTFRIGSLYSLTVALVPRVIASMQSALPGCDIELVLGSNSALEDQLATGDIDAALICVHELARDPARVVVNLFDDELYLVMPASGPAPDTPADLVDYVEQPFVVSSEEFSSGGDAYRMFQQAGISPHVAVRARDIFSLSGLVRGGVGLALLPGRIDQLYPDVLRFVPVRPEQTVRQTLGLCYLASRAREETVIALESAARQVMT